jgi:hypothetical protein
MKQRITIEQLNKLTHEQKERLREWWNPNVGDFILLTNGEEFVLSFTPPEHLYNTYKLEGNLPLLSIGQMIEFIQEKKPLKSISKARFDKWTVNIETSTLGYKDELCDSLWETMTRIL